MSSRDTVYSALVALMPGSRRLRPTTAVDQIVQQSGISRLDAIQGLACLDGERIIEGVARDGRPVKMIGWLVPPPAAIDPISSRWAGLVGDRLDVLPLPSSVRDLNEYDFEALAASLLRVAATPADVSYEDRYVISARAVMGSSKVLDYFPGLAVPACPRPLFVVTAGPAKPKAVLFVENPSAFTSLSRGDFVRENLAICTFGYGLTMENLGQRLLDGSVLPCSVTGGVISDLGRVISATPCFHWGDLDMEGLRIFEAMQTAVPHLRLSAIYEAMVSRLVDPSLSHPYMAIFGKKNQRAPRALDPIIAYLADACAERALDQEAMCPVVNNLSLVSPFVLPESL